LHYYESIDSRGDVVEHDSGAFWKFLQLSNGRGLDDIERSKKYKTSEKSFPRDGDSDEGDELPGDFVDYDELRIFGGGGPSHLSGGGDADQDHDEGESDSRRSAGGWRQGVGERVPQQHRCDRAPCARAGAQATDAEESGHQRCPEGTAHWRSASFSRIHYRSLS